MTRKMLISASLLFLLIGSFSANKQGDFGFFTVCTKNDSIRLNCYYADCPDSPSYDCEFMASNGTLLYKASNKKCEYSIIKSQMSENFTCILTRKKRKEVKKISINYRNLKEKNRLKPCSATTGQTPTLLCPVVILSLWTVLVADSQTT